MPVAFAGVALVVAACERERPRQAEAPPAVELLVEAGDSTYWIASDARGVRLRGSPVLLARDGSRYYELYVSDDDRSYFDAVFVGQQLWRRDLVGGDSALLFEDTLVAGAQRRWAARNPGAEPLDPEDAESDDPSTMATAEIRVLDVVGPYVSYELNSDVDVVGESHRHLRRRGVIDMRTGRAASLEGIVGERVVPRVIAEARRRYGATLDSIRRIPDERWRRVAEALPDFPFDPTSFSLVAVDGALGLSFLVPGRGDDVGGLGLPLSPVHAPAPGWWAQVAPAHPRIASDSVDHWTLGDGVALDATWNGDRIELALRRGATRWTVGHAHAPPRRLWRLDRPPIDASTRRALVRAFDESALYSDDARTALAHPMPRRDQRRPQLRQELREQPLVRPAARAPRTDLRTNSPRGHARP